METTFDVVVRTHGRVTIPQATRFKYDIDEGDLVTLTVVKVQKRKKKQ